MSEVEEKIVEEEVVSEPDMPVVPLFGKWDLTEVNIEDNFSEDNLVEQIEDFLNNEGRET